MNDFELLNEKLLSLRGSVAHVVGFGLDDISGKLLRDGIFFDKPKVITLDWCSAGLCHNNSIYVWAENMDNLRICTGYAIDKDVWYRHTWCVDTNNVIYECTPYARGAYYGKILDLEESKEFIAQVLYPNEIEKINDKIARR